MKKIHLIRIVAFTTTTLMIASMSAMADLDIKYQLDKNLAIAL